MDMEPNKPRRSSRLDQKRNPSSSGTSPVKESSKRRKSSAGLSESLYEAEVTSDIEEDLAEEVEIEEPKVPTSEYYL